MLLTRSVILFSPWMGCVRFPCYSDRKLTNGTEIWQENRLIVSVILLKAVFIFVSTFPLERFTLKVAFSPSGAVLSLNASVWCSWMISLNRVSCHRQISCLKVVLPQAKYIWGPKLWWLALIRRKDGSIVDSFEETLETCIILEPYNLDSSISSTKVVCQ